MTNEGKYQQFTADMRDAGYVVKHYDGRNFYHGPAVEIDADDFQDVVRATKLLLVSDQMGKRGLVVYPR